MIRIAPAWAVDSLVLSQARLGNIFLSTEAVQIPLQTTGDSVSWTVKDFSGVQVAAAVTPVPGNGQATIAPGLGRLGYFELHATAMRGGTAVASADTAFAVVMASNVAGMHDSPFGVMTHFAHGWTPDVMQVLARGGIAQFRDEQYWQNVEPSLTTPATYTFAAYQPYMAAAAAAGLNPLMELTFANTNYDGGSTPFSDAGRAGYSNYARALLAQYGSQVTAVEIWNEYNGSWCTGPAKADRPAYYTQMLMNAYTAIKVVRPDVRVVGGACVPVPLPWFQALFEKGAQDYLDVLDVHPYRAIPEGVELDIAALKALSASYNHGNGPKPIWATECGAPDYVNPGRQDMARYMVRLMTLMRTAGVERVYWYLAYDYDGYSTGLVRAPSDLLGLYVPSSAFPAYANLIRQLYSATYSGQDSTDARTRMYRFTRGGSDLRVVWSTTGTAQLVLTTNTPLTRIDIMGVATVLQPNNGSIALTADATPFYLISPVTSVVELARDVIVADTYLGFSGTQGATSGTWSYLNGYVIPGSAYDPEASTLTPMTYSTTNYGYQYDSFYSFAAVDANGGHPSARFGYSVVYPVWTIKRWLSSVKATATFKGTIIRASASGDGTGAAIYVDGNPVYSTLVGGAGAVVTVNFSFVASIGVGSKVDFVLTPGPGTDVNYDYVDFRVQVSAPPAAPITFEAWQRQNFTAADFINPSVSGDNATPSGDGVSNLFKYSANLSPNAVGLGAVPTCGIATIGSNRYLTLSYRQASTSTDLVFSTELNAGSLSLGTWAAGGVTVGQPVPNGDGTQTVTVRDAVPISEATQQRFMRLRVSRP